MRKGYLYHLISRKIELSKFFIYSFLIAFSINCFSTDKKTINIDEKIEYFNVKNAYYWNSSEVLFNQSLYDKYNPKSGFWLPLSEIIGFNLLISSYNRFVTKSEFAQISFESIKNNFKHGFDWDADDLYTNFWRHPYQGSIYYNTARSNGYSYYESMGFTFFGSLQWEFFMEIEPAAINDVILTTFAGAMVGEIFYRLANHVIDESSGGFERVVREGSLTFFNPGRLINRAVRGRVTRKNKENIYERRRYYANFKIGINKLNLINSYSHNQKAIFLKFTLNYDDPFLKKRIKPFDHFYLSTIINPTETNIMNTFRLFSILYGVKFTNSVKKFEVILGTFQNFDYLQNDIYQIGSLDLSFGLMFKRKFRKESLLLGYFTLGAVPMAGVNSQYAKYSLVKKLNMSRDYNLGWGGTTKLNLLFSIPYVTLKAHYTTWLIHSYHGANGTEFIGVFEPAIHINLVERISIGVEAVIYHRKANYRKYPDVDKINRNYKAFVEFKL